MQGLWQHQNEKLKIQSLKRKKKIKKAQQKGNEPDLLSSISLKHFKGFTICWGLLLVTGTEQKQGEFNSGWWC